MREGCEWDGGQMKDNGKGEDDGDRDRNRHIKYVTQKINYTAA